MPNQHENIENLLGVIAYEYIFPNRPNIKTTAAVLI